MTTVTTTVTTQSVVVETATDSSVNLTLTPPELQTLTVEAESAEGVLVTTGDSQERLLVDDGETVRQTVLIEEPAVQVVTVGVQGPPGGLGPMRSVVLPWAATVSVDWSAVDVVRVTLAGHTTFGFAGAYNDQRLILELTQDTVGGHGVTWPANVRYSLIIPSIQLSTEPGKTDRIGLLYRASSDTYDVAALAIGY